MRKRKLWYGLFSGVLALALAGPAGALNLLTDGGFEVGLLTGPDEWIPYRGCAGLCDPCRPLPDLLY